MKKMSSIYLRDQQTFITNKMEASRGGKKIKDWFISQFLNQYEESKTVNKETKKCLYL